MNETAQQIGEMFEEVVEHLDEYEYPYLRRDQNCANWEVDDSMPF